MPALLKEPTFQLPSNWTPEGTACVRVVIPNSQEFFSQLIGLIDTLKWSRNFQRDTTQTGAAIVSRVWQAALESQPIQIDYDSQCEGDMSFLLRQNPDDPCQFQQSIDEGESWTLAFDYSLCQAPAPIMPPNVGDDFWFEYITWITIIGTAFDDNPDATVEELTILALDIVRGIDPEYSDTEAVAEAAEQAKATGDMGAYANTCTYREMYDRLWKCNHKNQSLVEFLNNASDCMSQILDDLADEMIKALNRIGVSLSQEGINTLWDNSTPGSGAGFMEDCQYDVTLDFALGPWEFRPTLQTIPWACPLAFWDEGVGWMSNGLCTLPIGTSRTEIAIWRALPTTAQLVSISFEPVFSNPPPGRNYGITVNGSGFCAVDEGTGLAVWNQADFPLCNPITSVRLWGNTDNFSSLWAAEVRFVGKGHNPFIED